jgi:hypothetical protein
MGSLPYTKNVIPGTEQGESLELMNAGLWNMASGLAAAP